ncbi:hypothetical protein MLD38_028653 [Melastoma candidum]|uniref:Uncharacterized protein n=1 Tax=Melastoma candidum TaxID=119954 RepID=A0ACB9N382_9MYRT|nr:hypothetical protein MLD38_028653 [Melastoma candidum]
MRRSIVISLFLCFSLLVVGSTGDPVETTCSKTGNHDLCLSTLRADPRSSSADIKGLAEIALDAASAKSNEALNYFLDLLRGEGDPVHSRFCGTCIDTHGGNVKRIIPEALTDLTNNQFASAKESITTRQPMHNGVKTSLQGHPQERARTRQHTILQHWRRTSSARWDNNLSLDIESDYRIITMTTGRSLPLIRSSVAKATACVLLPTRTVHFPTEPCARLPRSYTQRQRRSSSKS